MPPASFLYILNAACIGEVVIMAKRICSTCWKRYDVNDQWHEWHGMHVCHECYKHGSVWLEDRAKRQKRKILAIVVWTLTAAAAGYYHFFM